MNPEYKAYHPRWHRPRMPIFWWLKKGSYARFILRELTSLFVAAAAMILLFQARAAGQGEAAYARFEAWLRTPAALILNTVILAFLLVHTLTWLNLAPRAMVVNLGGRRIPDRMVLAGHYLAWLFASGLVAWFLFGR